MSNPRKFIEKLNTSETLLGLDFGDKTIGIAVSDKSLTIASPITTILRRGISKDLDQLFKIIEEYGCWSFGLMDEDIPTHHIPGSKDEGKRIAWKSSADVSTNCAKNIAGPFTVFINL